jgi:UDP-2-acetamido-3-amino-2,3-dideoxy-glucuronate N-acetyltransferase
MSENIQVSVVGAGYWGKNLVRVFHELGVLRSVCEKDPIIGEDLRNKYPGLNVTASFDDVLRDPAIHCVVVATPPESHYELAKECLKWDKNLFVEKPMTLKAEEAKELVELSDSRKRILMVGHLLHYHPAVMKIKELLQEGAIGDLWYVSSHRLNLGIIRRRENALFSLAPHDISLHLAFFNSEPTEIYATGGDFIQPGVEDQVMVTMDFGDHRKAHIYTSWLSPFKERRITLVGSRGMLVFDDLQKNEKLVWYEYGSPLKEMINRSFSFEKKTVVELDDSEPLRNECIHFLECVQQRKTPLTDGKEGLRVLRTLIAAQRALKEENVEKSESKIEQTKYFIHSSSFIDENVQIGEGTKIWHFSHILKNTSIGKNCVIGQNVVIGPDVTIGNGCKIQNNVSIYKDVTLEDEVFCGPSMVFTNVINPRAFIERKHEYRKTLVKRGASIGANATIVCGVTLGQYSFVGAGTVVIRDIPDYALVVGNPSRQIGWMCRCGVRLRESNGNTLVCPECGQRYRLENSAVRPETERS